MYFRMVIRGNNGTLSSKCAADALATDAEVKRLRKALDLLTAAAQRALHPSCVAEFRRNPRSPVCCYVCEQIQSAALKPQVTRERKRR